jgi:hypothetical protein
MSLVFVPYQSAVRLVVVGDGRLSFIVPLELQMAMKQGDCS